MGGRSRKASAGTDARDEAGRTEGRIDPTLQAHKQAWDSKRSLRLVYGEYYRLIARYLAAVPGRAVELGSGPGELQRVLPGVVTSDLIPNPWVQVCLNAHRLPFADGSLANIALIDGRAPE